MNTPKYHSEVSYDPTLFTYTIIVTDKLHNKAELKITQLELDIEFHKLIDRKVKEGIKQLKERVNDKRQD